MDENSLQNIKQNQQVDKDRFTMRHILQSALSLAVNSHGYGAVNTCSHSILFVFHVKLIVKKWKYATLHRTLIYAEPIYT